MKNLSLTVKIWLAISLVSLFLYLVVILVMPTLIRNFLTDKLMEPPVPPPRSKISESLTPRGFQIRGFIMLEDGTTLPSEARQALPGAFLIEIQQNAKAQQAPKQLYQITGGQPNMRYVIEKNMADGQPLYQIMFIKKPEEDQHVRRLLFNVMLYAGLAMIISWLAAILIVRYLTRPLTQIKQHVKRIANRNWHEPLNIKQKDEFGQLAESIDSMRRQLIQQDEMQQSMLQNISHELKTPVMVIRSYTRAMQDGIYPKGDLTGSIRVIDEEGERLEKLIKQLLYLTRLDYLATRDKARGDIRLDQLIEKIAQRMDLQRPEITWQLDLRPVTVKGDEETLRAMIENLLDNHLRHAASVLTITLQVNSEKKEVSLKFWNDGSQVEPHLLDQIFRPFQKGREGRFGLGLTIVQRILKIYQGRITVANEGAGVATTVAIPLA
ncbi:MAG: HAMP domain-containing sensor histidine kinase [Bacillota bacterium]|jgi:two-component system sensor histidine kinase CssS